MLNLKYIKDYTSKRARDLLLWKSNSMYLNTTQEVFDAWVNIMLDFNTIFFGDIGVKCIFKPRLDKHIITGTWYIYDKDGFNFGFTLCFDEFTIQQLYIPEV